MDTYARFFWFLFATLNVKCASQKVDGQSDCDCGVPRRLPRIVNGEEVSLHRFPWTVSVALKSGKKYIHRCGGAIISSTYVLTAGHCSEEVSLLGGLIYFSMAVDIGDHDLTTTLDAKNTLIAVKGHIRHPDYDDDTLENDIALLKLERAIIFRYNVRPACLPPSAIDLVGKNITVVGWGLSSKGGVMSKILDGISVPVLSREECQRCYDVHKVKIISTFMCAGMLDGSKDACQGDSGGPATFNCDSRTYLVGIVSYGIGCATIDLPGVYTDVSKFTEWIQSNTKDDPACHVPCDF